MRAMKNMSVFLCVCVLTLVTLSGCAGYSLRHVGYTPSNKIWYHWVSPSGEHSIVVCNINPDGSESGCKESKI